MCLCAFVARCLVSRAPPGFIVRDSRDEICILISSVVFSADLFPWGECPVEALQFNGSCPTVLRLEEGQSCPVGHGSQCRYLEQVQDSLLALN